MIYKFSVAISVYKNDNADFFDRALDSITDSQTILPDEVVLVVDGPIDTSVQNVINKYTEKYDFFTIIYLKNNGGLGNALKLAIELCKHDLIARMDSDDISTPDRFIQQLKAFEANPQLDIIGGDISEFIGEELNVEVKRCVPCDDREIKEFLKKRCPFNHMSVMFKKEAVLRSGNYIDLFWNEDYFLWIRMVENRCVMANTGTILCNVRTGADMYKRRGGKKYFYSELFLQKYMYDRHIINFGTCLLNLIKRFIMQILLPTQFRGFIFRTFARTKI